jgi:hypothetical protein
MTEAQITTILSVFIDYADLVDVEDVEGENFYEVMDFLDRSLLQEPVVSLQLVACLRLWFVYNGSCSKLIDSLF